MPAKQLLAKIHIAKKQLCLDDDTYRAMLENLTGKTSSKDLTDKQLVGVIGHLQRSGWQAKAKAKKYDDMGKRDRHAATPAQLRLIEALWHDIYRGNNETLHLRQFIFRTAGVNDIRFLTKPLANKVIEGIKAVSRRKAA
jgi:hypothetical protein